MRAFATVGGWTMASRILGFARDILIAALVGAGPVAEAFFVAFRLPNLFRRFFAEGAFNTAFIPLFAKRLEGEGPEAAGRFAGEAGSALLAALLVLTALAQLAMPAFVWALASGLEPGTFDLAVLFSRICFPYILFISLAALCSGVLNAFGRFAAAAAAPVLLNVILIGAMTLGWSAGWMEGADAGLVLSWAAFAGGIAQLALVGLAMRRLGMGVRLSTPRLTPGVRRLLTLGLPAALSAGVVQINLLVGTQVASYFAGAVVWLWMADRVYQLPLGVIGIAIGVVLLPELARRLRAGDAEGGHAALNRATEFSLALTLPATVALLAMPGLVAAVLFERGAFTAADAAATGQAIAIYALGLPAFVLQKVLQPAFYAREEMRAPLRYALWSMAANVLIAAGGAPFIGWQAAPIATTVAGWLMLALLWQGARRLDPGIAIDARLAERAPRIVGASLLMGVGVWLGAEAAAGLAPVPRAAALAGIVALGAAAYAGAALLSGALRPADLRAAVTRSQP
ncbi:MAG: murein biosynthesis integral membrane protein MurJ [Pseudomonadota bacterium]